MKKETTYTRSNLTNEQRVLACRGHLTLKGVIQMTELSYPLVMHYAQKHGFRFPSRRDEMSVAQYKDLLNKKP